MPIVNITGGKSHKHRCGHEMVRTIYAVTGTLENNGESKGIEIDRDWVTDLESGEILSPKVTNNIINGRYALNCSEAKIEGFEGVAPSAAHYFVRTVIPNYQKGK